MNETNKIETTPVAPAKAKPTTSGFSCQECGKAFRTVRAAERASSEGCPKCGGCDIDLT